MLHFRLNENRDPEERLEEAALWKAMHDEYGDEGDPVAVYDQDGFFLGLNSADRLRAGVSDLVLRVDWPWLNPHGIPTSKISQVPSG